MIGTRFARCLLVAVSFLACAPACHAKATAKVLHSFPRSGDGDADPTGLTAVGDVLYGATFFGGASNLGTVFSITKEGHFSVVYSFQGTPDPYHVNYPMLYKSGALYGVSASGGDEGAGAVFRVTPKGHESVLYSFSNTGEGGSAPLGTLVAIGDTLYGTTASGGANRFGTIFSLTMSGKEKTLHSFSANGSIGLTAMNGILYGASQGDCAPDKTGEVFSLTTAGKFTALYKFHQGGAGYCPHGAMLPVNGVLYGTTQRGGGNDEGTVYSIVPGGKETAIAFLPAPPIEPFGNLVAKGGKLYSIADGKKEGGELFRVSEQGGGYKEVLKFGHYNGGFIYPSYGLVLSGGSFYGATSLGGADHGGAIFEIAP